MIRAKKNSSDARVHTISFRVNDDEKAVIERHAATAKNRNIFVREKVLKGLTKK